MTFTVKGIDHVVLRVADLARALKFYADVLGCREERRVSDGRIVMLRAGNTMIDLQEAGKSPPDGAPDKGPGNMEHFCVRIEPWDEAAIAKHLDSLGVKHDKAEMRFGADGRGPSIYIEDPDGNAVELKGPPVAA